MRKTSSTAAAKQDSVLVFHRRPSYSDHTGFAAAVPHQLVGSRRHSAGENSGLSGGAAHH